MEIYWLWDLCRFSRFLTRVALRTKEKAGGSHQCEWVLHKLCTTCCAAISVIWDFIVGARLLRAYPIYVRHIVSCLNTCHVHCVCSGFSYSSTFLIHFFLVFIAAWIPLACLHPKNFLRFYFLKIMFYRVFVLRVPLFVYYTGLRIRLGLRFQKVRFKNTVLKCPILKNNF
jgi:hypothetical protein